MCSGVLLCALVFCYVFLSFVVCSGVSLCVLVFRCVL